MGKKKITQPKHNKKAQKLEQKKKTETELDYLIDESDTTNATMEILNEKEKQEVLHQAQKGIASYQFTLGRNHMKENKDTHSRESSSWILRSALSGCSSAQVYVLDSIYPIMESIVGSCKQKGLALQNFNCCDVFFLYSVGYFLSNYRQLKIKKSYEDWQTEDNDLISLSSNGASMCTNEGVNKNLLSSFNITGNSSNNTTSQLNNFVVIKDDACCYEQLGMLLLKRATEKNYIMAKIEIYRKNLEENANESLRNEYHSILKSGALLGIDKAQYLFAEEFLFNAREQPSENVIEECILFLESSASNGFYLSQYKLALVKQEGEYDGVKSHKDSFFWCEKAAQHGFNEAEFLLSTYYSNGVGVKQNERLSFDYMMRADNNYHPEGALMVGMMYKNGIGCAKDLRLAYKYIKKSFLEYRCLEAAFVLATIYLNGEGTSKSVKYAIGVFNHAVRRNHIRSIYMLGDIYHKGLEVPVDYRKAFSFFKKSALLGDAKSYCKLASCFLLGQGIYRDQHRALACLSHALKIDSLEVEKYFNGDNGENMKLFQNFSKIRYYMDEYENSSFD
mmetsp:Transcript_3847/g.3929  ORF Transcript_3847/g.3929 Transcript_3847/m.3929 type:complete len:563 (+) Transcript_3847:102-1790(+)